MTTVEFFIQCEQPDGSWEQASSITTDVDFAAERLIRRREMQPEFTFRLAERTTTVVVRPLPDCLDCRHWKCDGNGPCGALLSVSAVSERRCTCAGPAAASSAP
ncbi:hypothetical protein [Streptomyces sp. AC555_RSS877]|uniref:hypothetical protein n=1 Tax=Streptomyces sp. AC555_RSS877 TaxID=2823688 RepID=UPI001C25D20B|nr:hypothetical protein [Streptomyces sp. AC555_RSS877]